LEGPLTGVYREKGSKFLSFAFPVASDEEIKNSLDFLRKKYFDARHHCYAWILGADSSRFRANDDGEPNHSAGDPILGQIRSHGLTNTLVVVVRYFGGIKLGVGGLIQAYRMAAADALSKANILIKDVTHEVTITYGFASTPDVMRLVKEFELEVSDQSFQEKGEMVVAVKRIHHKLLLEKLALLKALKADIQFKERE
jgi:uncharacterized YigZ family protein